MRWEGDYLKRKEGLFVSAHADLERKATICTDSYMGCQDLANAYIMKSRVLPERHMEILTRGYIDTAIER